MIILDFLKKLNLEQLLPYIIIGFMFWYINDGNSRNQDNMINFANALQDTVQVKMDKYGDKVYEISQLKTASPKIFLDLKTNDVEIQRLQAEVNKYKNQIKEGSSVTIFDSGTKVDTTLNVNRRNDGAIEANSTDGKWYSVKNIIVPNGESRTQLEVRNEYTIALVEEEGKSLIKIKNQNPFSMEGEIRSYQPLPKEPKKISIGVGLGYNPITGTVFPNVGVNYKIIDIR